MRIQALSVWATLLKLLAFGYAVSYDDFAFPNDQSLLHNYSRSNEIEKHCTTYISLASELKPDDDNSNRVSMLKNELSFFNGDWEQDSHGATLMPFDDSDMPHSPSSFISPLKIVSFEVQNVSSSAPNQPMNTVSISGVLSIGITRNSTVISEPGLKFHKTPGMSALRVDFEGVYLETEGNGGDRLICLLGNSTFPFKKVSTRFSDEYMTSYISDIDTTYNEEPVILHPNDQILLVLKYPKNVSVSTSRIHGEMTSLNKKEDFEYFDKVCITSQLGILPESYTSSSDELNLEFDQNPLEDAILEDRVNKFNNSELCRILKYFELQAYRVMPNLKLGGQNGFQDTVGPFLLRNEIKLVDRNNENLRVIFHKIICKKQMVSGVLRLYPANIEPHVAARRTGLSTLTLSVRGTWSSSTGILSMTGCLGPDLVKCDTGVILYLPKFFSSKQRSVVSGCIFSLKNEAKAFHPVFIGLEMLSPGLFNGGSYRSDYLSYNYSKSGLAIEFKERIQEPRLITYIRGLFLSYPVLGEEKDETFNISNRLSDDLKIDTFSSPETFVRIEVLSSGPLFRTNDSLFYEVSNHEVLNISLNLQLIENPYKQHEASYRHVSKLYLEGVYDQRVGKLYLIGCRKVDYDHVDLERGLDCKIEVTIQYSAVNTRWLINPTAKITIFSQRNDTDIYQFKTVQLHTFMIHDKHHEQNVIFRKILEGYFRVVIVMVYIAHILNQMKHMKKSSESVPYISLLMLALWIIGYGITLIYSKEVIIKSSESQHYMNRPYDHQSYKRYLDILDYLARFLILVTMILMARIGQTVLKSRKVLSERGEPSPSEKKVILVCFIIYVCYFLLTLIPNGISVYLGEVTYTKDVYLRLVMQVFWLTVHDIQDFFLVAQIIAFRIWKPSLTGPLFRISAIRIGILMLIRFVYEVVRDPVTYPA
uniref:uncharacterized protein LOC122591389 n=1 Tax=Erigeron canadensis TaxID=72917 RepID=UPI001CB8CF51|nr:uncharacterized protein LOC122591389 [Erigeron canadensis]